MNNQSPQSIAKPLNAVGVKTLAEPKDVPPIGLFVARTNRAQNENEVIRRPSISYWQDARMRLWQNKVAVAAGCYIILLAIAAAVIPEIIPYTYDEQEIWNKHRLPNLGEEALVIDERMASYEPVTADPSVAGEVGVAGSGDEMLAIEPPSPPQNLRLMGPPLTTGLAIQWDPVSGADGYRVYRSIAADTLGIPIEDIEADRLSFHDTASLSAGVTYYYHVTAFNPFGDSVEASVIEATPKLALGLTEAQKIDADAKPGDVIRTKPHYLGTDYLGRDLLARVMIGARVSLFIGIVAPFLYVLVGIIWGSISGYFGGVVDNVMMRIADVISTVPELLVVILLQVMLGSGITTLVIAMVAVAWARSSQQIRGEVLRLREMEFVHAAKVLGTGFHKTVFRHLLPNVMGTVLVVLTLAVPQAIFTEAFLSFIGLGIQPPMTSWGIVTKEGARVFMTYPHELIIPSVLICFTMLAFNLLGDGLRDALDPKLRGAK